MTGGKRNAERLAKRAAGAREAERDAAAKARLNEAGPPGSEERAAVDLEIRGSLKQNRADTRRMVMAVLPRRARVWRKRSRAELSPRRNTHLERVARNAAESAARAERREQRRTREQA